MKRISVILALLLILSLGACTAAAQDSNDQQAAGPGGMGGAPGQMNQGAKGESRALEGAKASASIPEGGYAVTGTVESIVGNEVTLLVLSTEQSGDEPGGPRDSGESSPPPEAQAPEEIPEGQQPVDGASASSQPDASEPALASSQASNAQDANAGEHKESGAETEADAETRTYLLPVGLTIGRGDFSSVKAGNKLRIVFGIHPTDGSDVIVAAETLS